MTSKNSSHFLATSKSPSKGVNADLPRDTGALGTAPSRQKVKARERRRGRVYAQTLMSDAEKTRSLISVKEQLFIMVSSLGGIGSTDIKQLTVESTKNEFSKILKNAREGCPSLVGGFKSGQEPVTLISTSQLIGLIQAAHIKPKLSKFLHPKPGVRTLEQSTNLLAGSLPSKKILL